MSATVRPLPTVACEFYLQGHCLYEERLNPGLHQAWRCVVWRQWEEAFDSFLTRAEAFRLAEDTAGRIWEKRCAQLVAAARACPDFVPGGADPVGCALGRDLVCLRRLPGCAGRCTHYRPRGAKGTDDHGA